MYLKEMCKHIIACYVVHLTSRKYFFYWLCVANQEIYPGGLSFINIAFISVLFEFGFGCDHFNFLNLSTMGIFSSIRIDMQAMNWLT